MRTFTYFAYGSNMLTERLQKRCETANFTGCAYVEGYKLTFNKKSIDGSGKATISQAKEDSFVLYGALYEISLAERPILDEFEGPGYKRSGQFVVKLADANTELVTSTYIAKHSAIDRGLMPYDWYKDLIIAGARQGRCPKTYVAWLEEIPSIPDPCLHRKRRKEALALLEKSRVEH